MQATLDVSDVIKASRGFKLAAEVTPGTTRYIVREETKRLHNLVKLYTTGYRGGPKIRTGQYNASIQMRVDDVGSTTTGEVGTDDPRGYRLEFGGTSQWGGRTVTTAPHPHFGPSSDIVENTFDDFAGGTLDRVVHKAINS